MAQLKQAIDHIKPVLVIFDTFASLVSDTDENSPSSVAKTLRLIRETCDNGSTSSMIVHHHGKDASKGMRTSPFKTMTGGVNAAIKSAVVDMAEQGVLKLSNGLYFIG